MNDGKNGDAVWRNALESDPNAIRQVGTSPTRRPRPSARTEEPSAQDAIGESDPWERALDGPPFSR